MGLSEVIVIATPSSVGDTIKSPPPTMTMSSSSIKQPNNSIRAPLSAIRECRVVIDRLPDAAKLKSLESLLESTGVAGELQPG